MWWLAAANVVFILGGAAVYRLARRDLLRAARGGAAVTVLVAGLAVGGFGLAHAGVYASWTGRLGIADLRWLAYGLVCAGALVAAQLALRLARWRVDPLVLPVATLLAVLGLVNLYAWELRDANAYLSTQALPALRSWDRVPVPNELAYERPQAGRYATVLDDGWLAAANATIRQARSIPGAPEVHAVRLDDAVRRQLAALVLALLLGPLAIILAERVPVARLVRDPRAPPVAAAAALLALVGASLVTSSSPDLPALLGFGGRQVTVFELLKLTLIGTLAIALGRVPLQRPARAALAAVAVAVGVLAWRDPGAGLALLTLAAVAVALVAGPRLRRGLIAAGVLTFALAPAAVRALDGQLPPTVGVRLSMWTDPTGAFERASVENDVRSSIARLVESRRNATRSLATTGAVSARLHHDVDRIEQELRWRLAALEERVHAPQPLVPGASEEVLLLEAERLWGELGGFRPSTRNGGLVRFRARLDDAIRRLRRDADRLPGRAPAVAPDNFQLQRAQYALHRGGALGVGLGRGRPEAVPALTEDVPLAGIGEALGFAGVLVTVLLVLLLAGRGIEVARGRSRPAAIFAVGIGSMLGLQALISLAGLTGVLPFTGLTFPFVSRSGTALVANVLAVALLAAVAARGRAPAVEQRPLAGAALPAAFALVLSTVAFVQLTGRTLAAGAPFAHLPGAGSALLHASDQWEATTYRAAPGPILDRRGRALARTPALGAPRVYPSAGAADSLAHTLVRLDLSLRERLLPRRAGRPLVGPPLRTTLDADVQMAVVSAFELGSIEAGLPDPAAVRGAVVVLDARDGGIVALLSRPSFSLDELSDPAAWSRAEARDRRAGFPYRYLHRTVDGYYPPGSIFKTVTAAGALERGLHGLHSRDFDYRTGPTGRLPPDGVDQLGPWHQLPLHRAPPITDGNHPHLDKWVFDLEDAFAWSCNVAFAQIGLELGPADLVGFARRFGFERRLAVTGLGASTSRVDNDFRKPLSKRFVARNPSNVARTAFGQGQAQVTPLQMALVPAAIANGGRIMQPRLLADRPARVFVDTKLSPLTLADLREMMWASATYGWARTARVNANNAKPGVAGKTGSAEWSETLDASHAWFIGYFPAERPRLALAVVVERGGSGPTTAARIARRVFASDAVQEYVRGTL